MNSQIDKLQARYQTAQDSRLYLALANHYIAYEMPDEALRLLHSHSLNEPIAFILLAKALELKERFEDAKTALEDACGRFPSNAYLRKRLSEVNCLLLTAEAVAKAQAVSIDSLVAEAHDRLLEGKVDEAMRIYDLINEKHPAFKALINKKLEFMSQLGDTHKVLQSLQTFLALIKKHFEGMPCQSADTQEVVAKLRRFLNAIKSNFAQDDVISRLNLFASNIKLHFARL